MSDATIPVRVQTRAKRDELGGVRAGALQVRLTTPPVDGRANEALYRLLAKRLGVPPSSVTIVRGHHSREKLIRVQGLEQAEVERTLGLGAGT